MNFGLIIVGDEIPSGKQDKHCASSRCWAGGACGCRAIYLGDDRERLTAELARSFASGDAVFCRCIGATPDDRTRQAAPRRSASNSRAPRGGPAHRRAHRGDGPRGRGSADMSLPENRLRLRMGEFPVGAGIVPNPFNRIPGFSIRNHFSFLASR